MCPCPRPEGRTARAVLCVVWFVAVFTPPLAAQQAPRPSFPITMQQAVQYATDNYPAIRASLARVSAQESGVDLARTAYLPRLDSSFQINRATRNNVAGLLLPGTTIPGISGPVSDASSFSSIWGSAGGLLLSWEALDFGSRGASVNLARTLVTRASAGAELTRLDVGVKTADAFLRLAAAQETVRAARANMERQQVFANSVAALVKNQLRPGADDSRSQAELALARIQLIQAEQAEQIGRATLAQWLGVSPADVQISSAPLLAALPPTPPQLRLWARTRWRSRRWRRWNPPERLRTCSDTPTCRESICKPHVLDTGDVRRDRRPRSIHRGHVVRAAVALRPRAASRGRGVAVTRSQ
jgi:outer membrane protein TolC